MNKKENIIEVTEAQMEWQKLSGFIELYLSYIHESKTNEIAYEAAEEEYQKIFRKRRYKSWESFLQMKWRYQSKTREQKKVNQ